MAKQGGPFILEGTYGIISFYRVGSVGLARKKSNLTRNRWKTDAAFARSRTCAANLATASKMASPLYQSLPVDKRQVIHFRKLLGLGYELLSAGFSIEQARKVMELATANLKKQLQHPKKKKPDASKPPQNKIPAIPKPFTTLPPIGSVRRFHQNQRRRSNGRVVTPQLPVSLHIPIER